MNHEDPALIHDLTQLGNATRFGDPADAPLAAILQIVIEAAVLSNKFEIDEQTPGSRLGALMDLVEAELKRHPANAEHLTSIIRNVFERVGVSIRLAHL
ncbi:MAG: hypothetical protein ACKVP3_12210 [Hyphomicrobiaceae bacterium]